MSFLIGWIFDLWHGFWFYVGEMVDDALDVWNFGSDEEDQW